MVDSMVTGTKSLKLPLYHNIRALGIGEICVQHKISQK